MRRGRPYDRPVTRDEWLSRRTFDGAAFDPRELADRRRAAGTTVSVVLPALDVADTIGPICEAIRREWMERIPLVDELVVVEGPSRDATAQVADRAGARVVAEAELLPAAGPGGGKGEAMWKSLAATSGDIVVWIDSDIEEFDARFVPGLLGPLLSDDAIGYVKALYRRALGPDADDGGRVTEICARPLLNRHFPDLAGFAQPLSGEAAGRRELLERVPFLTGYAVEIGLLIDIHAAAGLGAMAQVDLGARRHRNQPTRALGRMAFEILHAVQARVTGAPVDDPPPGPYVRPVTGTGATAFATDHVTLAERPPMASLRERAA
jgi:glucosyl-3-phosphoglycerate synthase